MAADYRIEFDISTIKHLGIQMYSTLPPVIAELVSNAWDADATVVETEIPDVPITDSSEIVVTDNGIGMTDKQIREAYLIVGRDRRVEEGDLPTELGRKVMARKGIGALDRTSQPEDGIQRGIVILARGKLVQEPFVFDATVGQQFALSYLVGELHAEFVDEVDDTIGTTRNSLVWDTEANAAFKEWGLKQVNHIARQWAEKRSQDNTSDLQNNPLYQRYTEQLAQLPAANRNIQKVTDRLLRDVFSQNPLADTSSQEKVLQLCLEFREFDAFKELAESVAGADVEDVAKLLELFREWEVIEAKEMMRVTEGRITTIKKLQDLIETNALEVPTIHNFLKEFPWVLDPRWTLVADEKYYSQLLSEQFPEKVETPEENKRIDFLCVKESTNLIVVEIKRPASKVSNRELDQIEEYVIFMRDHVKKTNDPNFEHRSVTGYLLCGDMVDTVTARGRRDNLENSSIYVRRYQDLLSMVEKNHREFLDRYRQLQNAKSTARGI